MLAPRTSPGGADPSAHLSADPGPLPVLPVLSVLVVDDDPAGALRTEAVLHDGGYGVVAEARGDAVLRHVRASLVRVVVAELYIACTEGRCVVTALKQDRARLPRLRVLIHTRHTAPADLEWAVAAGCDGVVPKAARDGVLLREVRRLDRADAPAEPDPLPPLAPLAPLPGHGHSPREVEFLDIYYVRWRVWERDARRDPGARGARCLIFAGGEAVRRVWDYPPAWWDLPVEALIALSWGR